MKTLTFILTTGLIIPAFAAESQEGMHRMPDGTMMQNHEMSSAKKASEAKSEAATASRVIAHVNGLVCDFCAQGIKKSLSGEPGVTDVQVDLTAKTVAVGLAEGAELKEARLREVLKEAGYDVTAYEVTR